MKGTLPKLHYPLFQYIGRTQAILILVCSCISIKVASMGQNERLGWGWGLSSRTGLIYHTLIWYSTPPFLVIDNGIVRQCFLAMANVARTYLFIYTIDLYMYVYSYPLFQKWVKHLKSDRVQIIFHIYIYIYMYITSFPHFDSHPYHLPCSFPGSSNPSARRFEKGAEPGKPARRSIGWHTICSPQTWWEQCYLALVSCFVLGFNSPNVTNPIKFRFGRFSI